MSDARLPPSATSADFHFQSPTWCPGCGDFGVLAALKAALAALDKQPHEVAVVTGVGCGAKLNEYLRAYGSHGIHGRALPLATGLKLARPELCVVAAGGDGDAYGIGGGHLLHAARRDIKLAYLVLDNQVYGLTKGQASPTSPVGMTTPTTPGPEGAADRPLNPLALALAAGAGFVAQGFSGAKSQLIDLIRQAITHPGFALVNVLSPCVTFNRQRDYKWYRQRLRPLAAEDAEENHNPGDLQAAMSVALAEDGRLPTGLLYQREGQRRSRGRGREEGEAAVEAAAKRCGLWPEELRLEEGEFDKLVSGIAGQK